MNKLMKSEWRDRISHWVRTLKDDFYQPLGEIQWEAFRTNEQLSLGEAKKEQFVSVKPGFTWGNTYEYCWMKGHIQLSEEANGKRIVMNLKPDGEATLFVNDKAFGTYRASWVNEPHHYIVDNVLSRCAKGDEQFDIMMEVYAGHYYPEAPTGGCATGPVLPGSYTDKLEEGKRRTLGRCTYGIWNEDAYQLFMDVDTLGRLLEVLDKTSLRAAKIAKALEQFTLIVDFEQERDARIESYKKAREALKPVLEAENGSTMPVFYAVGNAHLDLAWLWPIAETGRKTARTFAAQLRLIEEYPEYKFIQSQPAEYEMCRKLYPELFERIKAAVKKGQWIAEGAMWVEPDTNMASGEALIRQLLYGKQYYKEVFDVDSEVLWLPDTFGYTGALPQILKGCKVNYLVTQKIFWSYNEGEQFPYHYFNWEGIDGSRIVSFLPTSYTYKTNPKQLEEVWKNRSQLQDLDAFLLPFGYGDGGGGPTRDDIEYAKREQNLEGAPRVELSDPKSFFKKMDEAGGPVNTYVGELYFNAHRGTYTSQAKVKQNNRRAEFALREMEMWGAFGLCKGNVYDSEKADALWKELLLNQFHDILPGSSIGRVYEEARKAVGGVIETANKQADIYMSQLVTKENENDVTLFNSFGFERKTVVELPEAFADGAKTFEGEEVFVEKTPFGVKAWVTIPPCGAVTLVPYKKKNVEQKAVSAEKTTDGIALENSQVRVKINKKGEVTSFVLKESGREFAADALNCFHFYKDVPRMFDAWDIDSNYREQELEGAFDVCTELVADGIEAVIKVTGKIGNSSYTQYIRLAKDSRRLEFDTTIDWKELHRLLKTSFPVAVYAENGINEMQFGYVMRPTHRSREYEKDRFEVCNHRYSALCDASHGAAVLNDCKYGISMNQNALELTLLRAAAAPEMRADNQVHHFTYAFTAWEGDFAGCDVVKQGYELNEKPRLVPGCVPTFSMASVKSGTVVLDTIKPALDRSGDLILRLYESKKAAGKAQILLNVDAKKAWLCDMLENKEQEIVIKDGMLELEFGAFQIQTIRLSIEEAMA